MKRGNKLLRNLNSQAALEFLTTYGWAFLVILIMIGTLAYFGILKPSRLLPDRCSIGPEFECQDFQIAKAADSIKARLKNNVGEAISIVLMTVSTESAAQLSCTNKPEDISRVFAVGEIRDFTFSGCNFNDVGFVSGEKGKVLINIRYYSVRSGPGYAHDVSGEIFGNVV